MFHFRFLLRQFSNSRSQVIVFVLCVTLSLLTLTTLGGFSTSVRQSMLKDAKKLHGGDIIIRSHYPFSRELTETVTGLEEKNVLKKVGAFRFYSMAGNTINGKSILCDLKIVEQGYPLYGEVKLKSGKNFSEVLKDKAIIVEQAVLDRLGASIGDMLRIGSTSLLVADIVISEPDRPVSFFSFGPRIFIGADNLTQLDLITKSSRVHYEYLLRVMDSPAVENVATLLEKAANNPQEQVRTYRQANSQVKKFFENFLFFLNLIGLLTLLLAGVGIQTSLRALLRENYYTIAIMKSLGATGNFIILHYIGMIILLGLAGTALGLGLSLLLQLFLPSLFAGFLPADVSLTFSWNTVLNGIILGCLAAGLFSFLPLYSIREVKPVSIFQRRISHLLRGKATNIAVGLIVLFFALLVLWQLEDVQIGLYFLAGLSVLITMITACTFGFVALFEKMNDISLSLQQASRGLLRPGNATRSIIITLSTSLAVIFCLYLIDKNIRANFIESYPPSLPNAYFLDIQPDQKDTFSQLFGTKTEFYPVIRARLVAINNQEINIQEEKQRRGDSLAREFNLTYRDHLLEDERLLDSNVLFPGRTVQGLKETEVPVSVLDSVAKIGNIKTGDLLHFSIQGFPLKARVVSMRTRTDAKIRPFFYFVFKQADLGNMPHTIFTAIKTDNRSLAALQNRLAAQLPNISVIDISSTVAVLSKIMHRMSVIVQFFSSFSILAGILIIISSILATRLTRIREAVYYKILGARSSFVLRVFILENLMIGAICSLLACLSAQLGAWALCHYLFKINYFPYTLDMILLTAATITLVITVALGASLPVLRYKPVTFLRRAEEQ